MRRAIACLGEMLAHLSHDGSPTYRRSPTGSAAFFFSAPDVTSFSHKALRLRFGQGHVERLQRSIKRQQDRGMAVLVIPGRLQHLKAVKGRIGDRAI